MRFSPKDPVAVPANGNEILDGWNDASLYRALVERAPDALVLVDDQGRIALMNQQAERLFGYSRSELIGRQLEMLLPERCRALCAAHRARCLTEAAPIPMGSGIDLSAVRKDGTEFAAEISLSPIQGETTTGIAVAVRDITERRRAEAKFRAFVEAAPDATVIVDEEGLIVLANSQAERVFGYRREDLVGKPIELLLPERFRDMHERHRGRYASEPKTRPMGAGFELACRRADGSEFLAEISLGPIETEEGVLIATAVRDITERKRSEEKARRAERLAEEERLRAQLAEEALQARQQFLAIASHELRSPLNALHMQVEVLRHLLIEQSSALSDNVIHKAERVRKTVARLVSLVDNLLDLSRVTQGKLEISLAEVDLADIVREVAGRHKELAQHVGSVISVSAPRSLKGTWDRVRLEQVLTNLLSNALKFGAGQPIEVSLKSLGDEAALEVRDYGEGLNPRDLERNLRAFEGAGNPRRGGGLGLGLFLVNQIVAAHGGRIEVHSEPGEGATFRVILPIHSQTDA